MDDARKRTVRRLVAEAVADCDGDFLDEEKTPIVPIESMEEIMETLRSPGIPTPTSERVTRPIRPAAIRAAIDR